MGVARELLLRCSRSRALARHMTRNPLARRAVRRFMPGETLSDAIDAAEELRGRGMATILTQLGENVDSAAEADAVVQDYDGALRRLEGLDADISIKLTHLGLDLGLDGTVNRCEALVRRAATLDKMVAIDIESSEYVDRTLEVYRRLRAQHDNVAICLQAYLYRTASDLDDLLPLAPAVRLVKGAYKEPPDIAFPKKRDVDANFIALSERLLRWIADGRPVRAFFGTHDATMVDQIQGTAVSLGLAKDAFEFQMLYGIQRSLQLRLAAAGYSMRVLISYGSAWFPWFMRRLAERPANALFVLKNMLAG